MTGFYRLAEGELLAVRFQGRSEAVPLDSLALIEAAPPEESPEPE